MKKSSPNNRSEMSLAAKPGIFYGWYMVAASWVMTFLISAFSVGIFFKPMLDEFGWSRATLSLVQTVCLLAFAIASPFLGKLIDRFGPRVMILISVVTQTASGAILGLAANLWQVYIGRFLYEIRAVHASQVLVNRWFARKRGRALGIVATGLPIGALALSPLTQYMIDCWGWRDTMLFWTAVAFAVMLPLALLIKNNPEDKGYAPDGEAISSQTTAESVTPAEAAGEGASLSQAAGTGSFWLLMGTQFICGIGCGFLMTHTVIFATDVGYSAMVGASFLSVQGATNLIGVLVTGYISDRMARSRVLALTHLIRSLSFFAVVGFLLLEGGPLWLLFGAMALFGFGWYATSPLSSGLAADLFGYRQMGTIIGAILSCHMVGMAIGAYAGGVTFEATGSYFSLFLIQGILELVAVLFALAIRKRTISS